MFRYIRRNRSGRRKNKGGEPDRMTMSGEHAAFGTDGGTGSTGTDQPGDESGSTGANQPDCTTGEADGTASEPGGSDKSANTTRNEADQGRAATRANRKTRLSHL